MHRPEAAPDTDETRTRRAPRGLRELLDLRPGNTFVVWKLGRLGGNLKHLVTTVDELHGKGTAPEAA